MTEVTLFSAHSASPEETEALGVSLAELLLSDASLPAFVALYGDLGVGKTAFTRGVASVISPASTVRSPTFALVNEYPAKDRSTRFSAIFHFDMYRIESEDDLDSIGFWDYPMRRGLILTEWSENIEDALPEDYIRLTIKKTDENESARTVKAERIKRE